MDICYLCGRKIEKNNRSVDHVPPKQFFPTRIRKTFNLSLLKTLLTHKKCNEKYKEDEDYFYISLGVCDKSNPILKEVWHDIEMKAGRLNMTKLLEKIGREFNREVKSPGGIIIPDLASKTLDSKRIYRIIWKITRGLFFIEFKRILPDITLHAVSYMHGKNTGLDSTATTTLFQPVLSQPDRGTYRRIFTYKYLVSKEANNAVVWAYLLWDRHMFLAVHHNPSCECIYCSKIKQNNIADAAPEQSVNRHIDLQ